jgi:hypothetical protein
MRTQLAVATAVLVVMTPVWGAMSQERDAITIARQESPGTSQPQPGMQDMMKMHEQMMAEMKANRTTLDALAKEMNAASGGAKVDAIAAVVNELVRQQNAMHDRMGHMHEHMMSGRGMMGGPNMMRR